MHVCHGSTQHGLALQCIYLHLDAYKCDHPTGVCNTALCWGAFICNPNALIARQYETRPCIAMHVFAIRMHIHALSVTEVCSTALHRNALLCNSNACKCTHCTASRNTALCCNACIANPNALIARKYATRPCIAMHCWQLHCNALIRNSNPCKCHYSTEGLLSFNYCTRTYCTRTTMHRFDETASRARASTYIHTYTHTYIHTYIHPHTYIHIHKYIETGRQRDRHTYIHTYIHTYRRACIHA